MIRRCAYAVVGIALTLLAGCGDNRYIDEPFYAWNSATVVGAHSLDGIPPTSAGIPREIELAKDGGMVALVYGHNPPIDTSPDTVDALLAAAEAAGVPTYTFADLADPSKRGPAICLSFDDTEVDAWFALRPILQRHHARVTFFVTEYAQFTDQGRAELHQLYADGNSIEAHGVAHLHANEYIAAHGIDAYLADEVQPSIDILRADGFAPVAFAYPYGEHTKALDEAMASRVRFVRGISGHLKP